MGNSYDSFDLKFSVTLLVIIIISLFLLKSCHNTSTDGKWNDGYCPDCEVRYELRGVSGKTPLKHYACPECGEEVERY